MAIDLATQYLVLAGLMTNDYVYGKVIHDVDEGYFTDPSSAIIFKSFSTYYKEYKRIPSDLEMDSQLHDNFIPIGPTIDQVKSTYYNLVTTGKDVDKDYLIDQVEKFIKDVRIEKGLTRFIEQYNNNGTVDIEGTSKLLANATEYTISKSGVFKLSSTDDMIRARTSAIGEKGNSRIISSVLPVINESLTYGGFMSGTLSVIVSPPGCFVGSTKVMTKGGKVRTIDQLLGDEKVPSYDFLYDDIKDVSYDSIYLSGYTTELVDITFNTGEVVRCTPDHPFLNTANLYTRADELTDKTFIKGLAILQDEEYMSIRKVPDKVERVVLDEPVPVYGLVEVGSHHNYVVMTGSNEGVFVSNTGKTSYMVNEGAYAAKQGFRVLHMFLGDMIEFDGFVRYAACITGEPQSKFTAMEIPDIVDFVEAYSSSQDDILDRIDLLAYSSSEITVDQAITIIKNQQKDLGYKYDMVIFDYADNFLSDGVNSYKDGGDIYDKMLHFARENVTAVITGSQPKIGNWKDEILSLDSLAESSKKQQIADLIIGFNKPSRKSNVGSIFLSKVRRGQTGSLGRVRTDWSVCRIYGVTEDEYQNIKSLESLEGV